MTLSIEGKKRPILDQNLNYFPPRTTYTRTLKLKIKNKDNEENVNNIGIFSMLYL